jgi:hypothetical protein
MQASENGHDAAPRIERGTCYLFFAHDVGMAIDLDACARMVPTAAAPKRLDQRHPGPPLATAYRTPPLELVLARPPIQIAGRTTERDVEVLIHDFGVVSVRYRLQLTGRLDALVELSCELYDNATLVAASRAVVDDLLADIRDAVRRPARFDEVEPTRSPTRTPAAWPTAATTSCSWTGTPRCCSTAMRTTCAPCSSSRTWSCSSCATWTGSWTRRSPPRTPRWTARGRAGAGPAAGIATCGASPRYKSKGR